MDSFDAFIYNHYVDPEDEAGVIHLFGLTPENQSVYVKVNGFTPYMYIELPESIDWSKEASKQSMLSAISNLPYDIQPVITSFMDKKKLYMANMKPDNSDHRTYKFLFVSFRNTTIRMEFMKKMYSTYVNGQRIKLKFHEQDATPMLQFSTCRGISQCGWITGRGKYFKEGKDMIRESICNIEYTCEWKYIYKCKDEAVLKKVPKPIVLCFDCEANSSNISAMPSGKKPADKMFQVAFAANRHGEEKVDKYLLSLGNPSQEIVGMDVKIYEYANEGDLLCGFADLIIEIDPQVITGYNILGWDFKYLIERAKLNGVMAHFSKFGYLNGIQAKEVNIEWSSGAFNKQHFIFINSPGRLLIDTMSYVKANHKFSNYKLDTVAGEILKEYKDPLTHKGIFKCYRMFTPKSLGICGKYCYQDANVTLKLFNKLKIWVGACQMAIIFNVGMMDLYTQGQQVKIYAQVYRDCLSRNFVVQKDGYICGEDESYTGALVFDPVPGMYEWVVTFDFASLYPSVMMANNICYSTLVPPDCTTIKDEDCHVFKWTDTIKKKKTVTLVERNYRFLKKPIGIVPQLLFNLTSERKKTKKEMGLVHDEMDKTDDLEKKKDLELYYSVLDMRQNALKVGANSIYGGLGVRRGKLPFMPGAMCTTCGGRESIMKAKDMLEKLYPGINVYGDTDSLMYIFDNIKELLAKGGAKAVEEYAMAVSKEVSKIFPEPMKLEYENTAVQFLIFTKKRYKTLLTDGKYKIKGIMTNRRDNAPCCRGLYGGMLDYMFAGKSQSETEMYIIDELNKIYSHFNSTKDYTITKSIKELDHYKNREPEQVDMVKRAKQFSNKLLDSSIHTDTDYYLRGLPAHVQLAEKMRRRGMYVEPGSRIEFVITTAGGVKGKIWQKIESSDYYKTHATIIKLDMNYYSKSLVNPCDQAMEVMYGLKQFVKKQRELRIQKQAVNDDILWNFKNKVSLE